MDGLKSILRAFWDRYMQGLQLPNLNITVVDIIEIVIIAFIIYNLLAWIKKTRAWTLLKGILVILVFIIVAALCQMNTILWLAGKVVNIGIIAVIVIFQPELRHALEQLGRGNILTALFGFRFLKEEEGRFDEKTVNEIVTASYLMGKVKTGALIVIERRTPLQEYIKTGIELDSLLSSQLLINIFEHNTPLHDGAVIVNGNRVVAATCYLPLSNTTALSKELGTRHRAALGMSEVSDAVIIVVSEETGKVSLTMDNELFRDVEAEFLKNRLMYIAKLESGEISLREKLKRRLKDVE